MKSVQIRSFFCSVFPRIRTEYGEILRISPYSVRIRKNTDQKKLRIWTYFTQWIIFKKLFVVDAWHDLNYACAWKHHRNVRNFSKVINRESIKISYIFFSVNVVINLKRILYVTLFNPIWHGRRGMGAFWSPVSVILQ